MTVEISAKTSPSSYTWPLTTFFKNKQPSLSGTNQVVFLVYEFNNSLSRFAIIPILCANIL